MSQSAEFDEMGLNKLIIYFSIGIAGVVCLIFVLDLAFNIFGLRLIAMDILFILAAALVLWQGIESVLELR